MSNLIDFHYVFVCCCTYVYCVISTQISANLQLGAESTLTLTSSSFCISLFVCVVCNSYNCAAFVRDVFVVVLVLVSRRVDTLN